MTRPWDRRGFTLVEALVAMLLSSVVVILVASVFLVQNRFYADTVARTALHENVRGAGTFVTSELKSVAAGGIVEARSDSVVFRYPLVVGGVCDVQSPRTYLHFPLEGEGVDGNEVDGYAVRNGSTGEWTYTSASWSSIYQSSGGSAAGQCEAQGADTVGARADFYRLDGLSATPAVALGDLVMLYGERVFKVAASTLDPSSFAVYTGSAGETLTELATGLSPASAFQYLREGQTSYQDQVTGAANLAGIERIRLYLEGISPPSDPARDSLTFDLTLTVAMKNVG